MNEYLNIVLPSALGLITAIAGWLIRGILSDIKELKEKLNEHVKEDIRVQQKLEVEVDTIFRNLDKVDIKLDKILEK